MDSKTGQAARLEEYKLCRAMTEGLDRNIWQTATVFTVGSAAGLITVLKEMKMTSPYEAWGPFILGLLAIGILWTWYRLVCRWDSIKYAMILRMDDIERKTSLKANHYARYLDKYHEKLKRHSGAGRLLSELEGLINKTKRQQRDSELDRRLSEL